MKFLIFFTTVCFLFLIENAVTAEFIVHAETGLTKPLAPEHFAANWGRGIMVGSGGGVALSARRFLLISYTFHNFTEKRDVFTAKGEYVFIQSILLSLKSRSPLLSNKKMIPYYIINAGFSKIKTFDIYNRKSSGIKTVDELAAPAFAASGLTIGGGLGLDFELSDTSFFFVQVTGSYLFATSNSSMIFPLKFGVLFAI